ncbi:hypothetical protein CEW89_16200 [Celeribacter ethanolicus]|uniref:Alginate biosynthesis protein AlgF n=1 Tax=Celeribacter ethanolicus TaxID=1758178 RepID=A0A291GG32_9RHOB|nr:hypothetical protein [Celeribacter ethanolicus]ATG48976.1 hypothetical protein CEW89_16200 [Celeribacter ethanolicus]
MTFSLKTLSAAAIVAVAGSAAFAGPNYIIPGDQSDLKTVASVDLVRADENATLQVYNFHGGERGALLGAADVNAGANTNVKVRLTAAPTSDVEFVLVGSNGAPLAIKTADTYQ